MSTDEVLARLDAEASRPWLRDLTTHTLTRVARNATDRYAHIRLADQSGVIGELLDLLTATTDRLAGLEAEREPATSGPPKAVDADVESSHG